MNQLATRTQFLRLGLICLVFVSSVAWKPGPPGYTATRYPIVLVPGAILFELPFDPWSYWYGIVEALQQGGASVHVSRLPMGLDEVRGEILVNEIQNVIAITGASKVNLIGYSQGGETVRYAAATVPELVASVTAVGGPHQGSPVADFLLNKDGPPWRVAARESLIRLLFTLSLRVSALPYQQQDFLGAITALGSRGAVAFNQRYPVGLPSTPCGEGAHEHAGIKLYSWGGVGNLTNLLDFTDPLFLSTSLLFNEANDGMVSRCSSHFGRVIRDDFRQNHFDGINQAFGLAAWGGVNPKALFRAHANRLKNEGL